MGDYDRPEVGDLVEVREYARTKPLLMRVREIDTYPFYANPPFTPGSFREVNVYCGECPCCSHESRIFEHQASIRVVEKGVKNA